MTAEIFAVLIKTIIRVFIKPIINGFMRWLKSELSLNEILRFVNSKVIIPDFGNYKILQNFNIMEILELILLVLMSLGTSNFDDLEKDKE